MDNQQDLERRIRERAHRIWIEEGKPTGRAEAHWDMATELVAIEDRQGEVVMPRARRVREAVSGLAEPIEAVESLGDLPGRTDQGERQDYPKRRPRKPAAKAAR